ncbi:MAG: Sec-independent protein translocase protein TatB [Variibacter sp.]
MFDISWGELVIVGIVALVVIGPKELPTVLRTVGQWMAKMRRMASEFQGQFQEAMREAELADLKKQIDTLHDTTNNFTSFNPVESAHKEIEGALEDKPKTSENKTSENTTSEPASSAETAAPAAEPTEPLASPSAEAPNLSAIDLPAPEVPQPVTDKDFAAAAPPPGGKTGGGAT